jgi:hypothetical protein
MTTNYPTLFHQQHPKAQGVGTAQVRHAMQSLTCVNGVLTQGMCAARVYASAVDHNSANLVCCQGLLMAQGG